MKKLRIAQIAPPFITVPPNGYGGTEAVVANITEELVRRGHDVTLFAAGGSVTSAKLVSPFDHPLTPAASEALFSPLAYKLSWTHSLPYLYHAAAAFADPSAFDVIHDHTHYISVFLGQHIKTPMVSTYHGSLEWASQSPIENLILKRFREHNWIAISESQRRSSGVNLKVMSVIHHGVHPDRFSFSADGGTDFLWLGRITAQKGIVEAIKSVQLANGNLIISGIVNPRDQEFFETAVKPQLSATIQYQGPSDHTQKTELLAHGKALLYPILWEEPFGLVMIESMACGTPVIAYARGAAQEIIRDGVTGFLVNSSPEDIRGDFMIKQTGLAGLSEAIARINELPQPQYQEMRRNSRQHVEQNFTVASMVNRYDLAYQEAIANTLGKSVL